MSTSENLLEKLQNVIDTHKGLKWECNVCGCSDQWSISGELICACDTCKGGCESAFQRKKRGARRSSVEEESRKILQGILEHLLDYVRDIDEMEYDVENPGTSWYNRIPKNEYSNILYFLSIHTFPEHISERIDYLTSFIVNIMQEDTKPIYDRPVLTILSIIIEYLQGDNYHLPGWGGMSVKDSNAIRDSIYMIDKL
jgi:hypothetical protein